MVGIGYEIPPLTRTRPVGHPTRGLSGARVIRRPMVSVEEVKRRHEAHLMSLRGVVGVGIGRKDGREIIRVYVEKDLPKIRSRLPAALDDVPVEVVVTGTFKAL